MNERGRRYSVAELVDILSGRDWPKYRAEAANTAGRRMTGLVTACAIVNARSGLCGEDCAFCAQSSHYRTGAEEYPLLNAQRIVEAAEMAESRGCSRFGIVTSGLTLTEDELKVIAEAIGEIRKRTNLAADASLGVLSRQQLAFLRDSGLVRYHHNLETCSEYYPRICTTRTWQDNYDVIVSARALGLQTCCGGLFGLGESIEHRAMFLDELRSLSPDGIPINFLIPVPGTPLEGTTIIDADSALRIIAAARLAMPDKEIIICGGRCEALRDRFAEAFAAGADGLMIGDYLTVRGSSPDEDRALLRRAGLDYRAKGMPQ